MFYLVVIAHAGFALSLLDTEMELKTLALMQEAIFPADMAQLKQLCYCTQTSDGRWIVNSGRIILTRGLPVSLPPPST